MNYRFLVPARSEIQEAVKFYNQRQEALGIEFAQEVNVVIKRILADPTSYEKCSGNVYSLRTKRFPSAVFYFLEEETVVILAVMHLRRKQGYWKDRIE